MTPYEKLSLGLLGSIAQGIGLQIEFLRISLMPKELLEPNDVVALNEKQQTALDSWYRELTRLHALSRKHLADETDLEGDGNIG